MSFDHEQHEEMLPEFAKVGQKVPPFKMETFDPSEGGFGEVDLKALWGKGHWIILFFYPADFTFVCPTELADLASKHKELMDLGAEVISVSTDTKFTHLAWKTDERLLADVKYKMASDPTGEVSRFFDVWDYETGLDLRGTFIINPEGILVSSEINFYNVGRNADELMRKVKANHYLMDHPEEACPAKWEPGMKTLTPGEDLVGNVYDAVKDD